MKHISFILNGKHVSCEVEDDELLIYTLRERFKLRSVKEGCGIGECGVCTVLIDNEPWYSCLTLASKVNGHDVKTVEFLSESGKLNPIQEAFIKEGAVQCGYCTPGMLLSAYSLLLKNKKPETEEIKKAISGNLCRCTGYQQIIEAVKSASLRLYDEKEEAKKEAISKGKNGIGEVLELLERPNFKIIAGGTDILIRSKRKEVSVLGYVDISGLDELRGIRERDGKIIIGALETHSRISIDPLINKKARGLSLACSLVGSPQIRNVGTIGGNIVNASPAADTIPPLLIHDAKLFLQSKKGSRNILLRDFIIGPYKTAIEGSEILTEVEIKALEGYREGYIKVAKRAALSIARLSIAWAIKEVDNIFEDVRISVGSCTPSPFRAEDAEEYIRGKNKNESTIAEGVRMIISGILDKSGMRSSYIYKLPVLEELLFDILMGRECQ
jgi:carbon-monoxide dehydrogenase small subunit/xanthine dehydrogenase small subunit